MEKALELIAMTKHESHRESKKARLRQQLTELAVSYMLNEGYENLSVEKIAEEADVSSRTILRYFDSKAGLVTSPCTGNLNAFEDLINNQKRQCSTMECWLNHISEKLLINNKLFLRYVLAVHNEPALAAILTHVNLAYQKLLAMGFASDEKRGVTLADKQIAGALLAANSTTIAHWIEHKMVSGLKKACLDAAEDTYNRYKKPTT